MVMRVHLPRFARCYAFTEIEEIFSPAFVFYREAILSICLFFFFFVYNCMSAKGQSYTPIRTQTIYMFNMFNLDYILYMGNVNEMLRLQRNHLIIKFYFCQTS